EDHRTADRENAAIAADQSVTGTLDLACAGFAAKLTHRLGEVQHSTDMRLRQQAAMGVDRTLSAEIGGAGAVLSPGFTGIAEAEGFKRDRHRHREGVVNLRDVDIVDTKPGSGKSIAARRRHAELVDIR